MAILFAASCRLIDIKETARRRPRMLHVHKTANFKWLLLHGDQYGSATQCQVPGVLQ